MYILDTNIASLLMRGHEAAVERLARAARTQVFLPQPVIAEIEYGIRRIRTSRRRRALEEAFGDLCASIGRAEWDDEVSLRFGEVKSKLERAGTPIEDFDVAIAAHALAYDSVLVTTNTKHMARVRGLTLEDWTV